MSEPHYQWRALRLSRHIALVALVFVPVWPLVVVVLVELYDFPRSLHAVVGAPLFLVMLAVRKVTSFKCPECRRLFSSQKDTGTHLTNKRYAHWGASWRPAHRDFGHALRLSPRSSTCSRALSSGSR